MLRLCDFAGLDGLLVQDDLESCTYVCAAIATRGKLPWRASVEGDVDKVKAYHMRMDLGQLQLLETCDPDFRPLLRNLVTLVGPSVGEAAPRFSLDEYMEVLMSAIRD